MKIPATGQYLQAGPDERIHSVARQYMQDAGLPYNPPTTYAKVDSDRSRRIAQAFEEMPHDPDHPLVKASYQQLAKEVADQYRAAVNAGAKFEFWDPETQEDPYAASPRLAIEDLRNNHHMYVFPTSAGYGSEMSEEDVRNNPLLADSGERWNGKPVTYNDMFRAIHDYFGHGKDGVGFRADGEENAWRSHAAMFSPLARLAMTTETRGQNSWLNYGPHGDTNRTASVDDTVFADQKAGVLPLWAHHEGAEDFMHPDDVTAMQQLYERPERAAGGEVEEAIAAYHGSPHDFEQFDLSKIGSGQGEQAYGHGLYFASAEDLAKSYRDDLSSNRQMLDDRPVADLAREGLMAREATPDQEIARFVNQYGRTARNVMAVNAPHLVDRYDELIGGERIRPAGKMYEVRIKAHPDNIMDWDKPIFDQPNIMKLLQDQHDNLDPENEKFQFLDFAHKSLMNEKSNGSHAHYYLKQALGNKGASDYLNGMGIKGIKYLETGSRGVGEGTQNYVIFDDSLVNVARKYRRGGGVDKYADGGPIDQDEAIAAYHGSPHEFEQFDLSKIGTGEGAQAYGHGLYFAENEPTARFYRDSTRPNLPQVIIDNKSTNVPLHQADLLIQNMVKAKKTPEEYYESLVNSQRAKELERKLATADREDYGLGFSDYDLAKAEHNEFQRTLNDVRGYFGKNIQAHVPKGHMYEVRINAHPDHFLDWDKPLEEQPHAHGNLLNALYARTDGPPEFGPDKKRIPWDALISEIEDGSGITGSDLHDRLTSREVIGMNPKAAASFLHEAGIKGIKYLDASSRGGTDEPTRNYVVFDDKLVSVRRRYELGGGVDRTARFAGGRVNTSPTEAQKEAGNYRKGHTRFQGLDITIENPKGSKRSGVDGGGKRWSVTMPAHYGYIKRTEGADGDHVDVYLGPSSKSNKVFVVDQQDHQTKAFDEHKVMLGYDRERDALTDYRRAFSDGRGSDRIKHVTEMTVAEFKVWLRHCNTKKPVRSRAIVDKALSALSRKA